MSSLRAQGVAVAVVGAAASGLLAALAIGGGAERLDDGVEVAWALPMVRLAAEAAAVVSVGALLGALIYSPRGGTLAGRHARLAAIGGLLWAVAAGGLLLLVAADLTGRSMSGLSGRILAHTALYVPQGRAQLIAAIAGLTVFGFAWPARRRWPLLIALLVAAAGIVPAAFAGHAASSPDHNTATTSLSLHVLSATVWVGGLIALLLHARWDPGGMGMAARRYSAMALLCFAVVAVSGVINAWLRVGSIAALSSEYGVLLQVKLLAFGVLGVIGWWHRRSTLPRLPGDRSAFVRLGVAEVLIMAATVGVAVGLSRAKPPGGLSVAGLTPADALLGYPMPGPPTPASVLLDWRPDLLFTMVALLAAALYLAGVRRLRRDGVDWPVRRTAAWLAGLAVVLIATGSGLARYAPVLFSVHMGVHMLLSMLAPILLVLGAPVTLALRALPVAAERRYPGPREWLTAAIRSWPARLLTHPLVAMVSWVGGLYVMYFSDAYEYALRNHPAHLVMYAHFLLSGYLFFAVLISPDPLPRRIPHPARLVVLMVSLAFHAFFGVTLMSMPDVIAAGWFAEIARPWGADALTDQRTGGSIAWAIGELPGYLVSGVLFLQWLRADEREQRRLDRAADRDGDAALEAYNRWLQQHAQPPKEKL